MHTVDNAVILAAGVGSRLKHLTKKTPKPLLTPSGTPIIENIILKLKEKNINNIYIVVGYLKDQFKYLEKKFNVKLIINNDWKNNNNITSIISAAKILSNTLILNGDIIFNNNVIENRFLSAVTYAEKNKNIDEWIIETNKLKNITFFEKHPINKEGYYQRELTFITKQISEILIKNKNKINKKLYYEDVILEITKKNSIEFKIHEIKKNSVFDLDNVKEYNNYVKNYTLKEIQKNLLIFMKKTIKILEKNKINYHLAFGTVLGSIRHDGFIPWDDDIDICIIGKDYEKFLKIMENENHFTVVTKTKYNKYPLYYAKLVDTNFIFLEKKDSKNPGYPTGLYIDIFKLDFVDDQLKKKPFSLMMWQGINYIKNMHGGGVVGYLNYLWTLPIPQFLINKKVFKKTKQIIKKYETNSLLDIHNDASRRIYNYDWFKTTKLSKFCGEMIKIPKNDRDYLKSIYGETYLEIPKDKDKITHYKYFKVK